MSVQVEKRPAAAGKSDEGHPRTRHIYSCPPPVPLGYPAYCGFRYDGAGNPSNPYRPGIPNLCVVCADLHGADA